MNYKNLIISIALIPPFCASASAPAAALTQAQLNANAPIYFAIAEGFRLAAYVASDELQRAELEKLAFNLYGRTAGSESPLHWRARAKQMECLLNGFGVAPNYPLAYKMATALTRQKECESSYWLGLARLGQMKAFGIGVPFSARNIIDGAADMLKVRREQFAADEKHQYAAVIADCYLHSLPKLYHSQFHLVPMLEYLKHIYVPPELKALGHCAQIAEKAHQSEAMEPFLGYCRQLRLLHSQHLPSSTKMVIKASLGEAHTHAKSLQFLIKNQLKQQALMAGHIAAVSRTHTELSNQQDLQLIQAHSIGYVLITAMTNNDAPTFINMANLIKNHPSFGLRAEIGLFFLGWYGDALAGIRKCTEALEMFDWLSHAYDSTEANFHQRMMGKLLIGLNMINADIAYLFPDHYQRTMHELDLLLAMDGIDTYEKSEACTSISNASQSKEMREKIMTGVVPELDEQLKATKTLAEAIKLLRNYCAKQIDAK